MSVTTVNESGTTEGLTGEVVTPSVGTGASAPESRGGIYQLPVVGKQASKVRDFYDDMRPQADDSLGVKAGKQVLRYGAVAASGAAGVAVGMIVAL